MTAVLNGLSSLISVWGPSLVVKATVTLVLTLLVVRLAGQSRAAVRHLWLTAGFAVLLALPVVPALIPSVRVEVLPASSLLGEYIAEPLASEASPAATVSSSQHSVTPTMPRWTWVEILTALWLGGLLVFAMPVVAGVVQLRRFRRNGLPWLDGQRVVSALAGETGLRRPVNVALHESIGAPATCGIVRHTILFPIDARRWPNEDIARAAVHEVEHVRRADCLVNAFARVMCAVYWFHPLAWVAWRRLELEAERACDDAVLRRAEATTASRGGGPGAGDTRPARPGSPGGPPLFDPVNPPCGSGRSGPGILGGGGYPISWIVQKLSELTRRPVVDKTGLSRLYDFTLRFASEPGMYRIPGGMPLPPILPSAADPDAPSLNTALQEQLGLKLEDRRGPVAIMVIDRLEKPTVD